MRQHVLDRAVILSSQTRDLGEPILDLFKTCRRKLDVISKIARRCRDVFENGPSRIDLFAIICESRIVLGKLSDLPSRLIKCRDRRVVLLVQKSEGFAAQ